MSSRDALPFPLLPAGPAEPCWDKWYRQATSEQRQQILHKAAESGLVHAHQLPPPRAPLERTPLQALLADILAGKNPPLPLPPTTTAPPDDVDLDDDQRQAVARALASPDLGLIQGHPGCGKSRVVAAILRGAARQGRRILFAAASDAALDCVLERLQGELAPSLLRLLGANELVSSLAPTVAALTVNERIAHFDQDTLATAQRQVAELRESLDRLAGHDADWPALRDLLARFEAAGQRKSALEQQRVGVEAEVEQVWSRPAADLPDDWQSCLRQRDDTQQRIAAFLAEIEAQLAQVSADLARLDAEHRQLSALAATHRDRRWWTLGWWQARKQPDPMPRLADIVSRQEARGGQRATLEQRRSALRQDESRIQAEFAARRDELTRREIDRRRGLLEEAAQAVEGELAAVSAEWSVRCKDLGSAMGSLGDFTLASLEQAESAWREQRAKTQGELTTWQAWLDALQQARPGLVADLVAACRILALPMGELLRLSADRTLAGFDLLVIEEANRLGEKELLSVSRLAPACILVGEAPVQVPAPASGHRAQPPGLAESPGSAAFARLWDALHPDPRKASIDWVRSEHRLTARLRPCPADRLRELHREPVFDRPDIELAIDARRGQDPRIVEVSFPASMPLGEAKAFLYRELQDLSLQCSGHAAHWTECNSAIHLHVGRPLQPTSRQDRVLLDPGIHEVMAGSNEDGEWWTAELHFDRAAGWERCSAEAWVAERLGLRDHGRTAVLSRCHRARPELAAFLDGLLSGRPEAHGRLEISPGPRLPAEFIPVPPAPASEAWGTPARLTPADSRWNEGGTATMAPRASRTRSGAGLEIELGDPRRADCLPGELRSALPHRGIINYPEARLLVQTVEALLLNPEDVATSASAGESQAEVAILSLFPAQVELLRLLVQRSPVLSAAGSRVRVGLPGLLAHRECPLVCLGMTRSHASRAVPFSDDPRDLVLALTRATRRLLVFGDPGTMARRGGWFGGLDHLGESAGAVEQVLIGRVLAYLPEREAPAPPGRARESRGV